MFILDILKVIYSPLKAFKEIAQKPKFQGAFLILILFVVVYASSAYIVISKTYDEQTLPTSSQGDHWTENRTVWISNGNITESDDRIAGGFFGNRSIEFSVNNSTTIWMQLNQTEKIDCQNVDGYQNMSFRVKLASPAVAQAKNVVVYLLSSPTEFFYYNLTDRFSSSSNTVWNNLTIPVGPQKGWKNGSLNADWSNISNIKFSFSGSDNANWTVRLDGLFFRDGYKPAIDNMASYFFSFSIIAVMLFVSKWVLLGGLLLLLARFLGGKVEWKPMFVLVGFVLITMFVQSVINVATYSSLPAMIRYPLEATNGPVGERDIALNAVLEVTAFVGQIGWYVQLAVHAWSVALCAIAVRQLSELSWRKSGLIGVTAYISSVIIESLLFGY